MDNLLTKKMQSNAIRIAIDNIIAKLERDIQAFDYHLASMDVVKDKPKTGLRRRHPIATSPNTLDFF